MSPVGILVQRLRVPWIQWPAKSRRIVPLEEIFDGGLVGFFRFIPGKTGNALRRQGVPYSLLGGATRAALVLLLRHAERVRSLTTFGIASERGR